MKRLISRLGALLLAGAFSTAAAQAHFQRCPDEVPSELHDDGQPLPPKPDLDFADFARFCEREPKAVLCAGHAGVRLPLTKVLAVEHELRIRFVYRSDMATHHADDYWQDNSFCGDCEDYALMASRDLAAAGEGGDFMFLSFMMVPVDPAKRTWDGHATLWVETADAGTVEISVGYGGEPHPLSAWPDVKRMMTIRMDGKQVPTALDGYVVDLKRYVVVAK